MNPGFAVRLQSMRRALTTVIMPAIEPTNLLAQEQAALLAGHISMMEMQWLHVDDYARLCLSDLLGVAESLKPQGGAETHTAAEALAALLRNPAPRAEAAFHDISAALEDLVRAADIDGDPAFRKHLHREMLLNGNRQAARDRAWFVACGFDVNAADLPSIEKLLDKKA